VLALANSSAFIAPAGAGVGVEVSVKAGGVNEIKTSVLVGVKVSSPIIAGVSDNEFMPVAVGAMSVWVGVGFSLESM